MHSTYTHGKRRREEKNAKSDVFFFLPLRFVSFALVHLFAWFLITVWAHLNKPENIYRLIECWIKCNYFIVPTIRFCLSLSLLINYYFSVTIHIFLYVHICVYYRGLLLFSCTLTFFFFWHSISRSFFTFFDHFKLRLMTSCLLSSWQLKQNVIFRFAFIPNRLKFITFIK